MSGRGKRGRGSQSTHNNHRGSSILQILGDANESNNYGESGAGYKDPQSNISTEEMKDHYHNNCDSPVNNLKSKNENKEILKNDQLNLTFDGCGLDKNTESQVDSEKKQSENSDKHPTSKEEQDNYEGSFSTKTDCGLTVFEETKAAPPLKTPESQSLFFHKQNEIEVSSLNTSECSNSKNEEKDMQTSSEVQQILPKFDSKNPNEKENSCLEVLDSDASKIDIIKLKTPSYDSENHSSDLVDSCKLKIIETQVKDSSVTPDEHSTIDKNKDTLNYNHISNTSNNDLGNTEELENKDFAFVEKASELPEHLKSESEITENSEYLAQKGNSNLKMDEDSNAVPIEKNLKMDIKEEFLNKPIDKPPTEQEMQIDESYKLIAHIEKLTSEKLALEKYAYEKFTNDKIAYEHALNKNQELNSEIEELKYEINNYKNSSIEQQGQVLSLKSLIKNIDEKLESSQKDNKKKEEELNKKSAEVKKLSNDLSQAAKSIVDLQKQLKDKEKEKNDLQSENTNTKANLEKCKKLLQEKLDDIKILNEIREKYEALKYKSRGLENLGNTCYMNSVLQCLAHLGNVVDIGFKRQPIIALFQLLATMRNPASDKRDNSNKLSVFYRQLTDSTEDFERGRQCDPKYLLIYLQKLIFEEQKPGFKLFKWTIKKNFIHITQRGSSRSANKENALHAVDYPEESNSALALIPKYTQIYPSDFISSFLQFIHGKARSGYCTYCNKEVEGQEYIENIQPGEYINFYTQNSNFTCDINQVETFMEYPYKFELCNIVMRHGDRIEYGHNFAICKENSNWIVYNDSSVAKVTSSIINGPYVFMFKVSLV